MRVTQYYAQNEHINTLYSSQLSPKVNEYIN